MKLLGLCLCLVASSVLAQTTYRWVDEKGKVHYTDTPPPKTAKNVKEKKLNANVIEGDDPYALREAMKNAPITLYVAKECGDPCVKAKAYLVKRGLPYTEKELKSEAEILALTKLTGNRDVPALTVGATVQSGFAEELWASHLDKAGYPKNLTPRRPAAAPKPPAPKPAPLPATPPAEEGAAPVDAKPAQ